MLDKSIEMGRKKIQIPEEKQVKVTKRSISSFLNKEYTNYVMYTLENRAIPSIVDGLRMGSRKILYAALSSSFKNEQSDKLLALVGDIYKITLYPHGDASLQGTITELASSYKDNLAPLEIDGQGGSLRDPDAISAPRYLYIKLSKYAKKLYSVDNDLIEYVFDEGKLLEPQRFLPIIPTILTKRAIGLAVGYAFSGFSYNPIDVIDACISVILSGSCDNLAIRPYVKGIKQKNFKFNEYKNRWECFGEMTIEKDEIIITDLPYDQTFESFESRLNSLQNQEYFEYWENYSKDNNIEYHIKFKRGVLSRLQNDIPSIAKKLNLISVVDKDNFTTLDENNKLHYFGNASELVEHFVKYRLTIYEKRKTLLVSALEKKIKDASLLAKFISLVIKKKIKIANEDLEEVKEKIRSFDLPDTFINIPLSKITKTEYEKQLKLIEDYKNELEYVKNTSIEQMYINDLFELRQSIYEDFIV